MKKIIFLIIILVIGTLWYYHRELKRVSPAVFGPPLELTVRSGESLPQIANALQVNDVVSSKYAFMAFVVLNGARGNLVAKTYQWREKLTIPEVVARMTEEQVVPSELTVTLIEGWTEKQMAAALAVKFSPYYEGDFANDFLRASQEGNSNYEFLGDKPSKQDLEGYLFPDTYNFFINASPRQVMGEQLLTFRTKFFDPIKPDLKKQSLNIHQVVTVASILEREVRSSEDKRLVADIFYKRLQAGMPLQADSTVNYVTGKSTPAVSSEDLLVDSPYNTYKYPGLPTGPISNPGLDSLRAAVYPESNSYWYFLTTSDGTVIYSKTFAEHTQNKIKYLK